MSIPYLVQQERTALLSAPSCTKSSGETHVKLSYQARYKLQDLQFTEMSAKTGIFTTPKTEHGVPHCLHFLLVAQPSFWAEIICVVAEDFFPMMYHGPGDANVHA